MYSPAGTATARRPDGGPRIACASACRASWTPVWPSATGDEPPSSTGGHVDTLTAAPPVSLSSSSGASGAVAFAVPVLNRAAAAPTAPPPQPSCGALRTTGAVVVPFSSSPRLPQTRDKRTSSTPSRHGDGVVVTCTPVVAEWIREPSVESRRPPTNRQWPVSGGETGGATNGPFPRRCRGINFASSLTTSLRRIQCIPKPARIQNRCLNAHPHAQRAGFGGSVPRHAR